MSAHRPIDKVPGGLSYRIYDQTGQLVTLTCKDTPDMRRFIEWVRIHDRAGPAPLSMQEGA